MRKPDQDHPFVIKDRTFRTDQFCAATVEYCRSCFEEERKCQLTGVTAYEMVAGVRKDVKQ